ncbi:MAG TPA: DUF4199 domain-containing protein [Cytophaga sp.]|nr:DUF4199 domain-containing protein [Cytophaga sp.]
MIKKAALFSLLTTILYIIWLKIIVVLGISSIQIPMLPLIVNTLIVAVPLYTGLLYIRKTQYENEMNFSQSFYIGILISILSAVFTFVALSALESMDVLIPSLLADYKNSSAVYANTLPAKEMKEFNEQIDAALKQPYNVAKQNFVLVLLISAFSSTIISLFVRNKDTFTENK